MENITDKRVLKPKLDSTVLSSCDIFPLRPSLSILTILTIVAPFALYQSSFLSYHSIFFKDFIYLFMRDKEKKSQRHRQREKQAPCREPDVGLDPCILDHTLS